MSISKSSKIVYKDVIRTPVSIISSICYKEVRKNWAQTTTKILTFNLKKSEVCLYRSVQLYVIEAA